MKAVVTVVGKDRVGIVYEVSNVALDIRIQNHEIFEAMHRIG